MLRSCTHAYTVEHSTTQCPMLYKAQHNAAQLNIALHNATCCIQPCTAVHSPTQAYTTVHKPAHHYTMSHAVHSTTQCYTAVKPLYDAYTTYLRGARSLALAKRIAVLGREPSVLRGTGSRSKLKIIGCLWLSRTRSDQRNHVFGMRNILNWGLILLEMFGRGVPLGSPSPEPNSEKKYVTFHKHFQASKIYTGPF